MDLPEDEPMTKAAIKLVLFAVMLSPASAQSPQSIIHKLPTITVHPYSYHDAEVATEDDGFGTREWIAYCHPKLSVADRYGIRHYQYNGNVGCEYGLSRP